MCGPLAIGLLTFGVSAIGQVAQFQAQKDEAATARHNALVQTNNENIALSRRQMQEADALTQKKLDLNIDEAQRGAEVSVSAASGGVAGISVDNLLQEVGRRAQRNRDVASENTRMQIAHLQDQKKSSADLAQGRIDASPDPSPIGLVAGIAGSALSSYSSYQKAIS